MRIGIDARFFGPASKGLGRYTQKLIEHLERIDEEHEYVIFLTAENFDTYVPKNTRFTKVLADYRWYSFAEQIFFPRVLHKAQCDLIHFPHFNVPLFFRGKFIVTIHDLILVHYPTRKASTRNALFYWFKFMMYKIVIAHAIGAAQKIAAVSQFTADDIMRHYKVPQEKIVVTHEAGPDPDQLMHDSAQNHKAILASHSIIKPYLLYVGNAYPHKNVEMLVHAFGVWSERRKKTHQLVLVGRRDYFYERLLQLIAKEQIDDVVILDTVSDKDLATLYGAADAFVFPSLYEGFGLPPLEACAYGVPVLSSDHMCMREILEDAVLYCDARCAESIVEGMEKIVRDEAEREELRHRGVAQAKKYTWATTADKTYKIYKEFAKNC